MTQTATENHLIIEDVVTALTGYEEGQDCTEDISSQMARAAEDVDRRTARSFGKALLDSLCEDPGNLRHLEALLILGLAHPDVLRDHRISLAVEGRRLAVLLERAGEIERARCLLELLATRMPGERTIDHELAGILRRSGNTEELIERYLRRAEECVEDGRIGEAIPWLQEVLLLDRSRRDVARMIRDLRYQESERKAQVSRRNRLVGVVLLLTTAITVGLAREKRLRDEFDSISPPEGNFPASLYSRHEAVGSLLDGNWFWFGRFMVEREHESLEQQIGDYERERARIAREKELERVRLEEMAEAARVRAHRHFDRGEYEAALDDFRRSLSMASPSWVHRARVEADIAALEAWDVLAEEAALGPQEQFGPDLQGENEEKDEGEDSR